MNFEQELLTEKEKEYLTAVIAPFRERVSYIYKVLCPYGERDTELISISYDDDDYEFNLPHFKAGTMYKSLSVNKKYSLGELGL